MATRLDIVKQVLKATGDYSQVTDAEGGDYTDNGIDWHINNAQKFLDREFKYKKDKAWVYKKVTQGESLVTLARARNIIEVWVAQAGGTRTRLATRTAGELRADYSSVPLSAITQARPTVYACPITGLAPAQYAETESSLSTAGMTDLDYLIFGNYYASDAIVIMPPADGTYTVEILANCFSKTLTADADVSFWSINEPSLLVDATCLHMENQLHRNAQGYSDKLGPLDKALTQLFHDLVEEEASGVPTRFRMLGRC